jgi:hypothetical protein
LKFRESILFLKDHPKIIFFWYSLSFDSLDLYLNKSFKILIISETVDLSSRLIRPFDVEHVVKVFTTFYSPNYDDALCSDFTSPQWMFRWYYTLKFWRQLLFKSNNLNYSLLIPVFGFISILETI